HLVDRLVELGAVVRVVDNLSSGRLQNIQNHIATKRIEFIEGNLLDADVVSRAVQGQQVVFHLAADHGGRGYVDLHQSACATNLAMDGLLFRNCLAEGVENVIFASSGCVYPNFLQTDPGEILYLTEEKAGPPYDADQMYGWAKLMAELSLKAYYNDHGM